MCEKYYILTKILDIILYVVLESFDIHMGNACYRSGPRCGCPGGHSAPPLKATRFLPTMAEQSPGLPPKLSGALLFGFIPESNQIQWLKHSKLGTGTSITGIS